MGIREYDYYLAGLKMGSNDYIVRAAVGVSANGDRYYDHKLSNIEKGELLSYVHRITNPEPGKDNSPNQGELFSRSKRVTIPADKSSSPNQDYLLSIAQRITNPRIDNASPNQGEPFFLSYRLSSAGLSKNRSPNQGEQLSLPSRIANPVGENRSLDHGDLLEMTSRLSSAEIFNSSPAIDDKRLLQILQDDGTFDGSARFSRRKIRGGRGARFCLNEQAGTRYGLWMRFRSGKRWKALFGRQCRVSRRHWTRAIA